MPFEPAPEVVERYARLLVDFALADGTGVQPGETVLVWGSEETKPLFAEVCRAVWRAGGNVIQHLTVTPDPRFNLERSFYELATDAQLDHFPAKYQRGMLDELDHYIYLEGTDYPKALEGVDSRRMLRHQESRLPWIQWQQEKEAAGLLHWTLALWGTEGMASEAGLTIAEYWEQIIRACHLDDDDPVARWRETTATIHRQRDWLNSLEIDRLHLEAEGTDLWLTLGAHRKWVAGSGRNIPSFEIFTCPDWRGTNGVVSFSEPLYSHGSLVTGARLGFRDGLVVEASAQENADLLEQIVSAHGGNRVGEFSLTDARVSRIDRFMATTLYDENMGGPFGNTHLAVGMAFTDTYDGDAEAVTDAEWEALGFNLGAAVHTDIVSTTDRTVTAILRDGSERVIYAGGRFQLDDVTV